MKEALDTVLEIVGDKANGDVRAKIERARDKLSFDIKDAAQKYKSVIKEKWAVYNEPTMNIGGAHREYEIWKANALASDDPVLRARAQSNNEVVQFVNGGYYRMNFDLMALETAPLLFPDLVDYVTFERCFKRSSYTGVCKVPQSIIAIITECEKRGYSRELAMTVMEYYCERFTPQNMIVLEMAETLDEKFDGILSMISYTSLKEQSVQSLLSIVRTPRTSLESVGLRLAGVLIELILVESADMSRKEVKEAAEREATKLLQFFCNPACFSEFRKFVRDSRTKLKTKLDFNEKMNIITTLETKNPLYRIKDNMSLTTSQINVSLFVTEASDTLGGFGFDDGAQGVENVLVPGAQDTLNNMELYYGEVSEGHERQDEVHMNQELNRPQTRSQGPAAGYLRDRGYGGNYARAHPFYGNRGIEHQRGLTGNGQRGDQPRSSSNSYQSINSRDSTFDRSSGQGNMAEQRRDFSRYMEETQNNTRLNANVQDRTIRNENPYGYDRMLYDNRKEADKVPLPPSPIPHRQRSGERPDARYQSPGRQQVATQGENYRGRRESIEAQRGARDRSESYNLRGKPRGRLQVKDPRTGRYRSVSGSRLRYISPGGRQRSISNHRRCKVCTYSHPEGRCKYKKEEESVTECEHCLKRGFSAYHKSGFCKKRSVSNDKVRDLADQLFSIHIGDEAKN